MKTLSKFVNEALIQPRELGHKSDGLFELIAYNSDKSLVNTAKNALERIKAKAARVNADFKEGDQ